MASNTDYPELTPDEEDAEILHNIRSALKGAISERITGIGPVDDERQSVVILLSDSKGDERLPETLTFTLSNKRNISLRLVPEQDDVPAQLLTGPLNPPMQYSGPLMGGDPIWSNAASQWGTITFAVARGSPIKFEGKDCSEQSLTCNHVLDFPRPNDVSTPNFPNSMTLQWNIVPLTGGKWVDLAGALMKTGTAFSPLEVRGLGFISGVTQPVRGIRVSKYGATTGLTSGRDLGWAQRRLTPTDQNLYWVRRVGGYFATLGDSGAPVLDAERNFVGIVVSGKPGIRNETYYIQALPAGQAPLPRVPPAVVPELSCFVVDGI